jgi:anti-sigma regulatory factor (Ser/Thr protein kinase)
MTPITYELKLSSDPNRIHEVESFLDQITAKLPLNPEERDFLVIAVTEVVNNGIIHGNQRDLKKYVNLSVSVLPSALEITVRDQGHGFVPEKVSDPLAPENLLKAGGRGIMIVRGIMDAVTITPGPEGTTVKMTKNFSSMRSPNSGEKNAGSATE